jgi:CRP-like cAMP-binding protein
MISFKEITFEDGQTIFENGEIADSLFFVKEGMVEVLTSDDKFIASLAKGQSFGEQAFLKGGVRGSKVRSKGESICIVISSEEANKLLNGVSPLLVPMFEALLLQQNMNNELKVNKK